MLEVEILGLRIYDIFIWLFIQHNKGLNEIDELYSGVYESNVLDYGFPFMLFRVKKYQHLPRRRYQNHRKRRQLKKMSRKVLHER